jgi:reactive intermediate/imine deaminase
MSPLRPISTDRAPTPAGHYSQAIVSDGFVFVAGQLPIEAGRPPNPELPIERQTEIVFANVAAILAAADSSLDRIVSLTVYIVDIARWGAVNATTARILGDHRPARTTVPVPALHHGFAIEVQAIARVG